MNRGTIKIRRIDKIVDSIDAKSLPAQIERNLIELNAH